MSDSYCTRIGLLRSSTDRVVVKAEAGFDGSYAGTKHILPMRGHWDHMASAHRVLGLAAIGGRRPRPSREGGRRAVDDPPQRPDELVDIADTTLQLITTPIVRRE